VGSECSFTVADGAGVAYLVTSYKQPAQVLRLARTLRAGSAGAAIVVHHDDRRSSVDRRELEALGVELLEPPSVVEWGEPSQLMMVLRCLRSLLAGVEFDWVVLLSGQDYPIRPVGDIERSLAGAIADAFVEARPVERSDDDEFVRRYYCGWRRVSPPAARLARIAARTRLAHVRAMPTGSWVGVPTRRTPFGPGLVCHRGSDWFTLSRRAVEAIDRFTTDRPEVLDHYRRTLIPTESFVQTVLANDPSIRRSGDYRRFMIWDPPPARAPRVLRTGDLDAILGSSADFARKFDETVDSAVLDEIDRSVHRG
jgi:hypothetical protein